MPKKTEDAVHVQLMVTRIAPDRTAYKMYGLEFQPVKMLVSIPIDIENVTVVYADDEDGKPTEQVDYVVLNLDGVMELTGKIADAIDTTHKQFLNSHK